MYPTLPNQILTDDHFHQLVEHGYVILPGYIQGEELAMLQAEERKVLNSWDKVKDKPPEGRSQFSAFPYNNVTMAGLYRHRELLKIGRRYLKTEDVVYNVGYMLTRYPGFVSTESAREYGQIGYWIHLEEVGLDQAPMYVGSHKDNRDDAKMIPLAVPAGTVMIFTNYTWHKATTYQRSDGQRFSWGFMLGRKDHVFESLLSYTSIGQNPTFNEMIRGLTAEERCLFRFPPPNHPYYTKQTLEALEKQYPGWNARGEYKPMD